MKNLSFSSLLLVTFAILLTAFVPRTSPYVYAATASHVVISEVEVGGTPSTNEFVELYNPTGSNIDVTNWRLSKKTATGTETDLVTDFPAKTINAHGYLLLAHTDYDGTPAEDITYSTSSIASNNTVLLYDSSDVVVDKLGLGTATDKEGTAKSNPSTGASVERKASSTSDATSLGTGGTEEFSGNGEDTDTNSSDFVNRGTPQPQSIASAVEPSLGGTPTPTPTGSVTATPTPTITPTGSVSPTATNTPTSTPTSTPTGSVTATNTPTPTNTNTPTPTSTGTNTPTVTPTNTPTASPSATATNTPTPTSTSTGTPTGTPSVTATGTPTVTPTPHLTPTMTPPGGVVFGTFTFPHKTIECRVDFRVRVSRFFIMYIPVFRCSEI